MAGGGERERREAGPEAGRSVTKRFYRSSLDPLAAALLFNNHNTFVLSRLSIIHFVYLFFFWGGGDATGRDDENVGRTGKKQNPPPVLTSDVELNLTLNNGIFTFFCISLTGIDSITCHTLMSENYLQSTSLTEGHYVEVYGN